MNPNDDLMLAQLEHELRSLQPLPPDPSMLHRLERTMHDSVSDAASARQKTVPFVKPVRSRRALGHNQVGWKPWAAVAACAAVATGAVTWKHNQLVSLERAATVFSPGTKPNFVSRGTESQFQRMQAGGLIMDPNYGLVRQMTVEFSDQQKYEDESTGSVIKIVQPRVRQILVPELVQ